MTVGTTVGRQQVASTAKYTALLQVSEFCFLDKPLNLWIEQKSLENYIEEVDLEREKVAERNRTILRQ